MTNPLTPAAESRDPRRDPRPVDVVRKGDVVCTVVDVDSASASYVVEWPTIYGDSTSARMNLRRALSHWRSNYADAEIVEVAE